MNHTTLDKMFAAMQGDKGFPALEKIATCILSSLQGEGKSNIEIGSYVVEDAALTHKVLKLANSAMYTPLSKGSASVVNALQLIGSEALLYVVLNTPTITDAELVDDPNLARSLMAGELSRTAVTEHASDAAIATLMFDLGRLMTTKYLPVEAGVIEKRIRSGTEPEAAARAILGMTLQEVGTAIATKWNLPASILATIDGTGDPTLVAIARFSNTAAYLIQQGKSEEVNQLVAQLDLPQVDKSRLSGLVEKKLAQTQPLHALQLHATSETELADLLHTLTKKQGISAEELAAAMFTPFGDALETAHCLLFRRNPAGEYRVSYGTGAGVAEIKRQLVISAEFKPTAFHAAIRNKVDVSIDQVSRLKVESLPTNYRTLLPAVCKFLILPIDNRGIAGLLYCDWESPKLIQQTEMHSVKALRDLFVPVIAKTPSP